MAKEVAQVDAFLQGDDNDAGFEDLNASTTSTPFIRVIQKGSPEYDERESRLPTKED